MDMISKNASVAVDMRDAQWTVTVTEGDTVNEQTFESEERASEFAHGQRLRLGIVPQQDVS